MAYERESRAVPIEASVINEELDRVLASVEFQDFDSGCRLLQYIVGEALAGGQHNFDVCAVAHAVFDRDNSYDEENDPVVRIEANRIRRALERYYGGAGQNDYVRITLPKTGYAPMFSRRVANDLAVDDRSPEGKL